MLIAALLLLLHTFVSGMSTGDFLAAVKTNNIVMVTSPTCPWCKKAKEKLAARNVPYLNVDVRENPHISNYMATTYNVDYVPAVFYRGSFLGMFDSLERALAGSGGH